MIFDCVHLLYYKCHKLNSNQGGSYKDSLDWKKNKKATINPVNKHDKRCFRYAATVALKHEKNEKNPEKISKNKTFINKHNWKEINYPSEKRLLEKN